MKNEDKSFDLLAYINILPTIVELIEK